ncbi:MAG: hypothetical protein N2508_06400 [Anaerolineae bacterium]|nr:hypothetical protein [Anaerolineae bacterium]
MSEKPEERSQPTHIDTGGGAYIAGSVNVEGGDFIGRDKVNIQAAPGITVQDFLHLLA